MTGDATWNLHASPEALEGVAGTLRGLGSAGGSSRDTMDSAAFLVFAAGAWEGDTAAAYQDHRGRLSDALADFSEAAQVAARSLDETAAVLRKGQAMLDAERDRASAVSSSFGFLGMMVFFPEDEGEAATVRNAVTAAREIRQWVDNELSARRPRFDDAGAAFQAIQDAWQPRTVRHLNLNTGMGNRDESTTRDKLDELAEAIAAGDADVVTLQEVLENNIEGDDGLLAKLEEQTGQEWQLAAFGDPIQTNPWDPEQDEGEEGWDPDNPGEQGYGNAVLVRTGGAVAVPDSAEDPIDSDDDEISLSRWPDPARAEDRGAAVAELRLREPGEG